MTEPPFTLSFLARFASHGFLVFGLVEIAFVAFGAARSGVDAKMFAEMLVALGFFKFVVLEEVVVGPRVRWDIVKVTIGPAKDVRISVVVSAIFSALGWSNRRAKGFAAEIAH